MPSARPDSRPLSAADPMHPIDELAQKAQQIMSPAAWAYLEGGAVDGITLRRNVDRYSELGLLPRVCVDVSAQDLRRTLFGIDLPHPILLAPLALQRLFAPNGELDSLRGARQAGAAAVISMESSVATTELADEGVPFLQHLYMQTDRELTLDLLRMAEGAGARGIVLTLDNPVPGIRYRQDAAMRGLPSDVRRANLESGGVPKLTGGYLDASMTWKDVAWLAGQTDLPVIGKGILRADDARKALDAGVGGIVVSNHGGRNLDSVAHPIDCVASVAEAVGQQVPVLLDGGIRRGTDVLKALALGADAVLVGRPYIWGLSAEGAAGVSRVIEILRDELRAAMAMCGAATVDELTSELVVAGGRPGAHPHP